MKAIFYSIVALMLFSSATCKKLPSGSSIDKQLIGAWKYIRKVAVMRVNLKMQILHLTRFLSLKVV
jgi:hypothetical protein